VYTTGGVQQANTHIVTGSGNTNNQGNLTVTFTGSAVFTSGTSYQCTATAQSNASSNTAPAISSPTATGFTLKGLANTTYGFVCVGT
jgi:hypothetical protein